MSGHEKNQFTRPLPAMPATPRARTPVPAKEIKSIKNRDRNRLKKHTAKKSIDRLTLSSSSSSGGGQDVTPKRASKFGDPDITPRPLNITKALPMDPPANRDSVDLQVRDTMQSRWSTSTSDVASGVSRKESKKKIFGITIPFKRRVKSEQMPARLKISSGFFGGRFAGSKLSLSLSSPKYNTNNATERERERQWQSSRASSTMTVQGQDGALSDDDTPTNHYRFDNNRNTDEQSLRSRVPQRRHTLTGSLLGLSGTIPNYEIAKTPSHHSTTSVYSSTQPDNRASVQDVLSLFPKPPKRDSADAMQMIDRNSGMPYISETNEYFQGQPTRGFSNPLPVNLRASYLQLPNQWQARISTNSESYPSHFSAPAQGLDPYTTPLKRNPLDVPTSEPRSIIYTTAHRKPVLTHLDLQVTADIDTIEVAEEREIWLVVELNGSLANNRDIAHSKVNNLDILFLLDLSQNMSEQAMATMKSTVGYILENISGTRCDNFGMAAFTSTSACEVLMPMMPCTHQAKHRAFSLLHNAQTTTDPFIFENSISNVVRAACSMFMPGFQGKNKNLIILSSAVPANQSSMADVGGFEDVRIHVIGVSCVYWPISEVIYADARDGGGGFCFPTSMMDVTTLEDDHSTKLQAVSRRFVRALRSAESIGMMRDITVTLTPAQNTTIKAIIGKTALTALRPGERATIMIRMGVTSIYQRHHSISEDGLEALEEGLYATLGMEKMKILQVDVGYKHSLLPAGTILTTTATAEATIITKNSPWNLMYSGSSRTSSVYESDGVGRHKHRVPHLLGNVSPTARQNFVRKALIQKVVSEHKNPKDALVAIENIARTTEEKDLDYCNVVRELRYHIRIWNGRRRGRVLGFGSGVGGGGGSEVEFQGMGMTGFRISSAPGKMAEAEEKKLIRPFSFEGKTEESFLAEEEGKQEEERPSTPGLTNDSNSIEGEVEKVGYAVSGYADEDTEMSGRRFEGDSQVDGSSPMTVISFDQRRRQQQHQRPDDSATRLWKRIERAGDGGTIGGGSSIGVRNDNDDNILEGVEGLGIVDDSGEGGQGNQRRKGKKVEGVGIGLEGEDGGEITKIISPAGTLRDVRETEFSPFMI
ncbi:hypothetical protein TWF679_008183 [Orbilia oligospora]|uniref:VWFA domain-containing protein n=1 Tax=Orbilia oligospora TaxID=2813651 RepID=A0A8H8V5V1_ORBOL|nr:hypothetical protein TWF679_008183 [Orbilia oligospora]